MPRKAMPSRRPGTGVWTERQERARYARMAQQPLCMPEGCLERIDLYELNVRLRRKQFPISHADTGNPDCDRVLVTGQFLGRKTKR